MNYHVIIDNIDKITSKSSLSGLLITVLSGTFVFILGQLGLELFIKPLRRYKEIKAKIAYNLVYYANIYMNPVTHKEYEYEIIKNERLTTQENLRRLAAEIAGFAYEKWFFNYPSKKKIFDVEKALIGLSNSLVTENSDIVVEMAEDRVRIIKESLKFRGDII
jgi:hypothetical protein